MQKNEEKQEKKAEIKETGSLDLDESRAHHRIKLITIIGCGQRKHEGNQIRAFASHACGNRRQL